MEKDANDLDWKIALRLGLGWTQQQAADDLSISRQTVNNHLGKYPLFFDTVVADVQAVKAKTLTPIIEQEHAKAEDRIKSLFDRSLKITAKLLDKAEAQGDEITIKEALEIHKNLTVWASKFAASEAPKRMELASTHTEVHQIDDATFARLEAFMSRHQALLPPSDAIDAELVTH